jgi:hypothetical protein
MYLDEVVADAGRAAQVLADAGTTFIAELPRAEPAVHRAFSRPSIG